MEEPIHVKDIVIAHAGKGTENIGRFDIVVDTDDNCIDSYTWNLVPINNETSEKDYQLEEVINKYKDITDRKYQRIITRFNRTLTHPKRNIETPLGSLFADIFKDSLGIDIMFLGSGSIRGNKLGPIVELGGLTQIFPYDDQIYMVKINGKQLKDLIVHILRDDAFLGVTEYYQLSSGIKIIYSRAKKLIEELHFDGEEVSDDRLFTIGMQNFHYLNMQDFFNLIPEEVSKNQKPRIISTSSLDIIIEYLSSHHKLDYDFVERVVILD